MKSLGCHWQCCLKETEMFYHRSTSGLVRLTLVLICCLSVPSLVAADLDFDWATVGNAGNAGDVHAQGTFGAVDYTYLISKTEVTNAQYAEFLNAVAKTDAHGLYNTNMGSNARGGITRSGDTGSFQYAVKKHMGNKPVNYVSFVDAMRFVNWLQNGQGDGATESGVYLIGTGSNEVRDANAQYFIPNENEWYKAAYHKNDGVTGNYFEYPTCSEEAPTVARANASGDVGNPGRNVANYTHGADWNGQNGNVTTVGSAGADSASPYGTFDQGGNVGEWNEAVINATSRGLRGGSWNNISNYVLSASARSSSSPTHETFDVGFRVARMP